MVIDDWLDVKLCSVAEKPTDSDFFLFPML